MTPCTPTGECVYTVNMNFYLIFICATKPCLCCPSSFTQDVFISVTTKCSLHVKLPTLICTLHSFMFRELGFVSGSKRSKS